MYICKKCGVSKPLEQFVRWRDIQKRKTVKSIMCKECSNKAKAKNRSEKHPILQMRNRNIIGTRFEAPITIKNI